ncbi:hypothetical protein BE17_21720 [Sorangium cellulosum]|uniref:Uncharacterized protein n=1 Tax=Sorangium cellulosum TaxID=56 RepID=A0A150R9C0_SORCE|nr:hypothetical protein BE17_21720 [Sorangium cellulosum]
MRIACQIRVKDLDGHDFAPLLVMGLPHGGEAAATDLLKEQIASVVERVSGPKLSAIADLALQAEDLLVELVSVRSNVLQRAFSVIRTLDLLAQIAGMLVGIYRYDLPRI